jgi:hypothetical protein
VNRRFGEMYHLLLGLATRYVLLSFSDDFSTLNTEVIHSPKRLFKYGLHFWNIELFSGGDTFSETSVQIQTTFLEYRAV